jgi:hypothetical protein
LCLNPPPPRRYRGQQTLFVKKDGGDSKQDKVAVDGQFARRMWRIIKIMVPGVMSVEAAHAATAAALLVARTYCDLWMVRTTTHIEGMIINRDVAGFKAALWKFALASVPIALVNNLLKYSLEEMTMHFRERLTCGTRAARRGGVCHTCAAAAGNGGGPLRACLCAAL